MATAQPGTAANRVIVVGGGLAGLSAAHSVLEHGGAVLLLDKSAFCGGNSTKATSGINGAGTRTQQRLGVRDSIDAFIADTTASGKAKVRPALVEVLCGESGPAVEWLQGRFGLDLSLVSRLGGHSFERTHRGAEKFPGMTITYGLLKAYEAAIAAEPSRAALLNRAKVTELLRAADGSGRVVGVAYEHGGARHTAHADAVIIATGGYGADFTPGSLLQQYRPDVSRFATTNGEHCTGDGVKMGRAAGAALVDMELVQVHPTGLVDPREPDSKVKFLAAEALRGSGGVLIDRHGKRFCNELGTRDYVSGEMLKHDAPFRLLLNSAAAKSIEWHCKHYAGRGLMHRVASGRELAAEMGVDASVLADTFTRYSAAAAAGSDPLGRKYFANTPLTIDDAYYVSEVTPVVHYTMGGLAVSPDAEVLAVDPGVGAASAAAGTPRVGGLFAAGEVMGGVHGQNRLGGSSLLDCVVFGRVSGRAAARYLLARAAGAGAAGAAGAGQQRPLVATVTLDPAATNVNVKFDWGTAATSGGGGGGGGGGVTAAVAPVSAPAPAPAAAATAAAAAAAPAAAAPATADKEYTREEVAKHKTKDDCWVIIKDQVLDVTGFLDDHPGGAKAILLFAGQDATDEFQMLHEDDVIERFAPECVIGKVAGGAGGEKIPRSKL